MSISIKPAELVGVKVGDRVTWLDYGRNQRTGTVIGVANNSLDVRVRSDTGISSNVAPGRLAPAPREWKVGDEVRTAKEYDSLPANTIVRDPEDNEAARKVNSKDWEWTGCEDGSDGHNMREEASEGLTVILYLPEKAA